MRTLLLLRHAKSSRDDASLLDFERPLKKRGRSDARLIGKYLREHKIEPDLVISSPAERTRQTTLLALDAARLETRVRYDERIYEASAGRLLICISEIEKDARQVLLVGHNPGCEELLERLTGEIRRMRTAALARICLEIEEWSEPLEGKGRLEWLIDPKELENRE